MRLIDLTGGRFGRLIVVSRAENEKNASGGARWNCMCDCGNASTVASGHLRKGEIMSCGCLRDESLAKMSSGTRGTKYVFGVGLCDVDYAVKNCPYYIKWTSMLRRCYYAPSMDRDKAYCQVTVCAEWLFFSVFREWMKSQDWQGKELDKDLLSPGNLEYGPDKCCFISSDINKMISSSHDECGIYPQGVRFKQGGKFSAEISIDGKKNHIGYFNTPETASIAYRHVKNKNLTRLASKQTDPRIKEGLLAMAGKYACHE